MTPPEWTLRLTTPAEEAARQAELFDWRMMAAAFVIILMVHALIDWWQLRRRK